MDDADVTKEKVGGRTLRVATWRLDEPSDHPPILFFNGIGANIEALAPFADEMNERAFIMLDLPGVGESPDPLVPYNPFTISWAAAEQIKRQRTAFLDAASRDDPPRNSDRNQRRNADDAG